MSSFEDFIKTWRGGYLVETDNDHSNAQYAAALAAWRAAQLKWQPISTAPEREHILILVDGTIATGNTYDGNWWATMPNGDVYELDSPPTHWMPLPHRPRSNKNDRQHKP